MPALSPPGVTRSSSDCELLIQRIMEAVCSGRSGIQERPQGPDIGLGLRSLFPVSAIPGMDAPTLVPGLEGRMDPSSPVPLEPVLEVDPPVRGWDRVCFSCGHQGHGVSRCSRMKTSFPFLLAGWLVGWLGSEMAVTERHGRAWMDGLILREKGDGPGGRVSLPDHRRLWCD